MKKYKLKNKYELIFTVVYAVILVMTINMYNTTLLCIIVRLVIGTLIYLLLVGYIIPKLGYLLHKDENENQKGNHV